MLAIACAPAASAGAVSDDSGANFLDTNHSVLRQRVDSPDAAAKFVRIDVTYIENPKRIALTFSVDYEPVHGPGIHLGSFSPYPADNPGTFIVPTRGKLSSPGFVIVSMRSPDDPSLSEAVRVGIDKITLIRQEP